MTASDLAALSRLATVDFDGDSAVEAALALIQRRLGARHVSLVYGWSDGFRHVSTADAAMDFTPTALWLVNRDLTMRPGPRVFDRVGARVVRFRDMDTPGHAGYVASLIPTPQSVAQMLVASGDWPRGFAAEDVEFITAAGPALAILMERGMTLMNAGRERNQLAGLMHITRVIAESEDLEDVMPRIAKAIATVADVEYVSIDIMGRADDGGVLRSVNYRLPDDAASMDRWRHAANRPDPIRDEVMATRRPALFPDAPNDPRLPEAARAFFSRSLIRSTAVFALVAKDDVLGVLSIAAAARSLTFDSAQVELFEGLALQIATAVTGIQLYHEVAEKSQLLERALEAERDQARRDGLTGALNHAAIAEELERAIAGPEPAPVSVIMVDVDQMKAVNDTFGHLSGDAVLRAVAEVLAAEGGEVGRYGGDEFLVILRGAGRRSAERYVQAVLAQLEDRTVSDPFTGAVIRMEVSAGLAVFPEEAGSIVDLIKIADSAMYTAKAIRAAQHAGRHDERASKMIGELIPLLTSPGELTAKLELVAGRLASAASYDGVICRVVRGGGRPLLARAVAGSFIGAGQLAMFEDTPFAARLRSTGRPIVIDDADTDERIKGAARQIFTAAGLRSGIAAPMIWQDELLGVIVVARSEPRAFSPHDAQFLMAVANQVTAIVRMSTIVDELQTASEKLAGAQAETVMMLAAAAEAHDQTTGKHLQSIRAISEALARELGYSDEAVTELGLAATLHDIGKISVPDAILSSPMRFDTSDWEAATLWETLKRHSVWGAEFLAGREGFELASRVARWHHERWDGRGYPDGIAGEEIPEEVAIVSVADALDAMTSDRPYRAGRPLWAAVREVEAHSGRQFSPRVVEVLLRLFRRGDLPGQEESEQVAA